MVFTFIRIWKKIGKIGKNIPFPLRNSRKNNKGLYMCYIFFLYRYIMCKVDNFWIKMIGMKKANLIFAAIAVIFSLLLLGCIGQPTPTPTPPTICEDVTISYAWDLSLATLPEISADKSKNLVIEVTNNSTDKKINLYLVVNAKSPATNIKFKETTTGTVGTMSLTTISKEIGPKGKEKWQIEVIPNNEALGEYQLVVKPNGTTCANIDPQKFRVLAKS